MNDIKVGDRVKIKGRPDWYVPSGYKLEGATGRVVEIVQEPLGYVMVMPDKDIAGIDERIPLGFRIEAVEKV